MDKNQNLDQVVKGGALGVIVYLCDKYNVDIMLTALLMPLATSVLAWASTKIGDPMVASFLTKKPEDATGEEAKK
jgi:hypothetical protein